MPGIATASILNFLEKLGEQYKQSGTLLLLGGAALNLLGSPRLTGDIDYVGSDLTQNELQRTISQLAIELDIEAEPVPFDEFVPFAEDASERQISVGRFGQLDVYIVDPYAIALSKLERGFETDLDDIVFLIHQELVTLEELSATSKRAIKHAHEFNLDVARMRASFVDVENRA